MHRESDQHPPREDDELEAEPHGSRQGDGPSRAEERRAPQGTAGDDPEVPPLGGGA